MPSKAMFLIRLQPGQEEEFRRRWAEAEDELKNQHGFLSRELIRVVDSPGSFVALSEWESADDYWAWRHSGARWHVYEEELNPLFSAPPITGIGDVVIHIEAEATA